MLDPQTDVNLKPLVCKVCASQCKTTGPSCCASNDFLRACRYHYIAGTNVQALRDLIEQTQGMDNFCEVHRYLYDYVITFGNEETIGCKQCIVELFSKPLPGAVTVKLLNQQFFDDLQLHHPEKFNQIEQTFQKMEQKLKKKDLQETLKQVDLVQQKIETNQQGIQQIDPKKQEKIKKLNELKSAFERRLCAIAELKGYHEYLHDDFIEDKSLRQSIQVDDQGQNIKGYSKKEIYELLDFIQFI